MTTQRSNATTSPPSSSGSQDPIGPHDDQEQGRGASVQGGGGEGTPAVNLDDEEIYSGRAKAVRSGGTANAKGGDSAPLGPPAELLSDTNGPSDPDTSRPVL